VLNSDRSLPMVPEPPYNAGFLIWGFSQVVFENDELEQFFREQFVKAFGLPGHLLQAGPVR